MTQKQSSKLQIPRTQTVSSQTKKPAGSPQSFNQNLLKSPPKTDFYLLFALFALFMTMVFM